MNVAHNRPLSLVTGFVGGGLFIAAFYFAFERPAGPIALAVQQPAAASVAVAVPTVAVNRTAFDANADWSGEKSTDVLQGSFPIEASDGHKFAWIGPSAQVTLAKGKATTLHLIAWAPIQLLHDRSGITTLIIGLTAGGKPIGEIRRNTTDNALIDQTFDITAIPAAANGNVTIGISSSAVVPASNNDQRQLSLIVSKIAFE